MRRLVLSPILVSTTALFHIACGSTPEWSCAEVSVPGGSTTECVSTTGSALTLESDSVVRSYECDATIVGDCPPEGASYTSQDAPAESTSGSGSSGGAGGAPGTETPGSYVSSDPLLECAYGPDLSYCSAGSSSGGSGSTGSTDGAGSGEADPPSGPGNSGASGSGNGGSTGTTDKGNGGGSGSTSTLPPGQGKKTDAGGYQESDPSGSGGAGSSGVGGGPSSGGSASGGSSGSGGGKVFQCSEYESGKKVCRAKEAKCGKGLKPSTCGACVDAKTESAGECSAPSTGGCWVTGGGFISDKGGRDNFGGNAKSMKDGRIQGEWNHVDHESGEHIHGRPSYLFCRQIDEAGPGNPGGKKGFKMNQVFFGGDARLQLKGAWTDGFWFDAMAKDHGEGKNVEDAYEITVRQKVDPTAAVSGSIVYQTVSNAPLAGGNVQLHPPNGGHPYSSTTIPSWVKL